MKLFVSIAFKLQQRESFIAHGLEYQQPAVEDFSYGFGDPWILRFLQICPLLMFGTLHLSLGVIAWSSGF